jgi:hypothetical protein
MPTGYCPCCGATYESPTLTANGPVCRFCLPRGDIVVLLPVQRRRFARTRGASERPRRLATERLRQYQAAG